MQGRLDRIGQVEREGLIELVQKIQFGNHRLLPRAVAPPDPILPDSLILSPWEGIFFLEKG